MNNQEDKRMSEDKKATGFQGENIAQTATSSSAEDAMVPTFEEPRNLSEKELALEKKLVRKIDIRLMPCLILLYILNYLDRNSPSAARDVGLVDDLGLVGQQYPTILSILYVGYILFQIPSNLLLAKVGRPRIYIPVCVAVWGVVSALTAVVHNFTGLLLVRFFLGVVESAFFPGALFVISSWYTKKELSTRMAMLYSGSILSNAISGLISAGIIGGMEGVHGIRA